ncbi:carbonyl reductase, partial [Jaminaea rosea]
AIISGANQGVGNGVANRMARLWNEPQHLTIYFTSRNEQRGHDSLAKLKEDLKSEKVGDVSFEYHQLDITDEASRTKLLKDIKEKHGGLDILVNNAGIAGQGFDASVVEETLKTNYYSTVSMANEAVPIIRQGGRIVSVASMAGKLNGYGDELTQRFKAVSKQSEADQLMKEFYASVADGTHEQKGWKSAAYSVSKAGLIANHRALAKEVQPKGISVFTCCPGYVDTSMTKHKGVRTLDEGAVTPVACAFDAPESATGSFWENGKESTW